MRSEQEISDEVCAAFRMDMQTWVRAGESMRTKWPVLVGEARKGAERVGSPLMPIWREVLAVDALLTFVHACRPRTRRKFWCWSEETGEASASTTWAKCAVNAACDFGAELWIAKHFVGVLVVHTRDVLQATRRFEVELSTIDKVFSDGRKGLHLKISAKPVDDRGLLD